MYAERPRAAGRFSVHAGGFSTCPPLFDTDEFIGWLADKVEDGTIGIVAPTSDYVNYAVAEVEDRLGIPGTLQGPSPDAVRRCIFKTRFVEAMRDAGFPPPPTATPSTPSDAVAAAEAFGYPVLLKPRSHIGLGLLRGYVAATPTDVRDLFNIQSLHGHVGSALEHEPDLSLPVLQQFRQGPDLEVVSIIGAIGRDGQVHGLNHCRKLRQYPGPLGVGISFEPISAQPYTEQAVAAVREIIGVGLFELEVIHDPRTGESMPIDLNPRGYGQISLAMALGHDLPSLWYTAVTGQPLVHRAPRRRAPQQWTSGADFWIGHLVHLATRPRRLSQLGGLTRYVMTPRVGAVLDWRDPMPGLAYAVSSVEHPRTLIRSFLTPPPPGVDRTGINEDLGP